MRKKSWAGASPPLYQREKAMLTVSDTARKELEAFFADKDKQTIRIFLAPGGCCGPRLALALDEAGENDEKLEDQGFSFCIARDLLAQVRSVAIDLNVMGFTVDPEVPLPSSGGGCGTCGGCGSH